LLAALVQFLLNKANLTETQGSFLTNILNADLQMRGPGLMNRDDKTGTNIRIHCQCHTPIWFQKNGLHE